MPSIVRRAARTRARYLGPSGIEGVQVGALLISRASAMPAALCGTSGGKGRHTILGVRGDDGHGCGVHPSA